MKTVVVRNIERADEEGKRKPLARSGSTCAICASR
jgi:hypothetical protein